MLTREMVKKIIDNEMFLLREKIRIEMDSSIIHIMNKLDQRRKK